MYARRFSLDGIDGTVHGFTVGHSWNGFECPLFTFEQAVALLRRSHLRWEYRPEEHGDLFVVYWGHGEPDIFEGIDISDKHLYPVGAFCWAWSKVS